MNLWARIGLLVRGTDGLVPKSTAGQRQASRPAVRVLPEVRFEVEPYVGLVLDRSNAQALRRLPQEVRRSLAIGLREALTVIGSGLRSRATAVESLRAHAGRCREVCERGLSHLLTPHRELAGALAWLHWALSGNRGHGAGVNVIDVAGVEGWVLRGLALGRPPLVVWVGSASPGARVREAARRGDVVLLASEDAQLAGVTHWRARGGYSVEWPRLPGLSLGEHIQLLSATATFVQALLADVPTAGWWPVRPPPHSVGVEGFAGLRALKTALSGREIGMVPSFAGSSLMLVPPLFRRPTATS